MFDRKELQNKQESKIYVYRSKCQTRNLEKKSSV